MKNFNLTEWALNHRAVVLFLILAIGVGGLVSVSKLGQLEDPEVLDPVDDGDRHLARRDCPAGAGRAAQPHGKEVRAARPLRQSRHVRAPGLRRHDDHRRRRNLQGGSARGLVPGAQEIRRPSARAPRRRRRSDLQRRVRRRVRAALCRQGRRHRSRRARRRGGGRQAPPAEGAESEEGGRSRQAGRTRLHRVLARASRRARHHASRDHREPQEPEQRAADGLDRHARRPGIRARQRPVRERGGPPQPPDRGGRPRDQAGRFRDRHPRLRGSAHLHGAPQRPAGADARHLDDR